MTNRATEARLWASGRADEISSSGPIPQCNCAPRLAVHSSTSSSTPYDAPPSSRGERAIPQVTSVWADVR